MVMIMDVLKSMKIVKLRGILKGDDQGTKESLLDKGYDSNTQDEAEGGMGSLKKGFGCSSRKKKKIVVDYDSN